MQRGSLRLCLPGQAAAAQQGVVSGTLPSKPVAQPMGVVQLMIAISWFMLKMSRDSKKTKLHYVR